MHGVGWRVVSKKLTIRDIAHLAGVSTATVSRVMNQKPEVDPATRERVLGVIQKYGFVPNVTATSLAGGRSPLLGVLVPSLTWPLMPEIIQGVAEAIERSSYELVLYNFSHRTDRSRLIDRILSARLIQGLLAVYPDGIASAESTAPVKHTASDHLRELYAHGFPIVMLDDQNPPDTLPWVGPDNRGGAYDAVRHLVGHGHRRIAYIQGPLQYQCSHDRFAGYQQALAEAGIPLDPTLIAQGDFTTPSGAAAASQLLALDERPSAVFAANDQMAHGVLDVADAAGLRLPDDLAVVGFDDISLSVHTHPALTTVRQPFADMGRSAVELLLAMVSEPRPSSVIAAHGVEIRPPAHVQWPTTLVVRASCGDEVPSASANGHALADLAHLEPHTHVAL